MTTIGERVRVARIRKGMTQAKLGQHIGLSADEIGKIERGSRIINAMELMTVAEVLGVLYDDLASLEPMTDEQIEALLAKTFGETIAPPA